MALHFAVDSWAALAPGLATREQWLDWFREPRPLAGEFAPDLAWVPAALRRRVSPLGRAALNVLASCQPAEPCPAVFASRHGDLEPTAGLLAQLHQEGVVSPMGFSLAVHNAAMGIYSIARDDRVTTTSIAANTDLAEAACCEALGWLAAGEPQVLVVCCADPVPAPYQATAGTEAFRYAWACRLRAVESGGISLALLPGAGAAVADSIDSASLRALAFLAGARAGEQPSATGRYLWRRHA
jgi:hypothetical protein